MVTTSCVLNAPRCVTTVPRVHLHGSPGGVFVGHRPPRDPGDPPHIYINTKSNRSFTSVQMCHTHTLDKNGSLYDPAGTESCDMHIRLVTKIRMSIYIYGTMVTTSCVLQLRPGASPQSRGYVYTGAREVSSLVTDLPGTPVTPRL